MAFAGYLLKLGDFIFPLRYMLYETYEGTYHTMDRDSERDARGVLIRNVLPHASISIDFDVKSLNDTQVEELMTNIANNYIGNAKEKKLLATFWVSELSTYITDYVYLTPNLKFTIKSIDDKTNTVTYNPTSFKFTGY